MASDDSTRQRTPQPSSRSTPPRVGKFEVLAELGAGGMGVVYRARDTRLNRLVALKLMHPDRGWQPADRERFLRECRTVASLQHPNIAVLFEADEADDGALYFAAELVDGQTVRELLREGPIEIDRAVDYGLQLASALAEAHDHGIVHRDIKPANIMVTSKSQVKVLDFGLARPVNLPDPDAPTVAASSPLVTVAGAVVGTPAYMAPEQAGQEAVGPRADVYAAGLVLFEMVTGRRPEGVSDRDRRMPKALAAVVTRCLQRSPADRFADGRELWAALSTVRRGRSRGRRTWAAVAGIVVMALAAVWFLQRPGLAFAAHDRLLIADVTNATSESAFSGALGTALAVDLQQSRYATVVGRRELANALQLTRRAPDTPLDLETALDVARWLGAKAVLVPSIVAVGDTFQLEAIVYATATESPVDRVRVVANNREAVLQSAVDELTAEVRQRLGESLPAIARTDAPVVAVTTASWEALQGLTSGLAAVQALRWTEAARFFEEALRLDPEFVAAKTQLALLLLQFLDEPVRGRVLLAEAAAATSGTTEYERVMLQGLKAQFVDQAYDAALDEFRIAATMFPDRSEPYQNLGVLLRNLGRFQEATVALVEANRRDPRVSGPLVVLWFMRIGPLRDPSGALAAARALVELAPDNAGFRHMLGWSHVVGQRYMQAYQEMATLLVVAPGYTRAEINLAHLANRLDRLDEAVDRYDAIVTGIEAGRIPERLPVARLWLALAWQATGASDQAEALLARTLTEVVEQAGDELPGSREAFSAMLEAARGRRAEANAWLARLPPVAELDQATMHVAASAHAQLGQRDRALDLLAELVGTNPSDPAYYFILPDFRRLWEDPAFVRLLETGKR